ncbi:MAG: phosphoribosylformylglycinamidine synthase, partial [Coriobacteriales bacterium]|nr:phosphoribosylformylglycinamidine synthase [Coriobacteriales bacterium]
MVSRVYVEKRPGFNVEARELSHELRHTLGMSGLQNVRIINRYDVEGISPELFRYCVPTVFSEPQSDTVFFELPDLGEHEHVFAVEFLPGQFDQRAASASECVQLISQGERPEVASAKVFVLEGDLDDNDVQAVKRYVINPVEAREASLETRDTLALELADPQSVEVLEGFGTLDEAELAAFIEDRGLAMDLADITFCQQYFAGERRDPTITEIKMIDTYWSDHCRHTTFGTVLDEVTIDEPVVQAAFDRYLELRHELGRDDKPVCLMDMGTIGAKWLQHTGQLTGLDESEEINACTVKVTVDVDGTDEDWLFLFKNETHNHPTEIEPFGGAATCIGGAIRDPLSGRSYVYQAMRVTGAADPTVPVADTLPGKLPQRKLVRTAAAGYSSYGNQIGLATGQVSELYHPGYVAKRMEIGAVVGATPASHVRRECPAPGDVIVLLGGRTGRDGIGGATGSSKAHKLESLTTCGAEVQKGNAPIERKL